MKLKLVVASMSVLSIISVPTFAYLTGANPAASTNSAASSDNSETNSASDTQSSAATDAAAAAAAASAAVHGSNASTSTDEAQTTTAPTKSTATHSKKSTSEKNSKPVVKTNDNIKESSKTSSNKTHKMHKAHKATTTTHVTHKPKISHTHRSIHKTIKNKKHANKTASTHKKARTHEKHLASKHNKHAVPVKHKAIVKHAVPAKIHKKPAPIAKPKHVEQAANVVPASLPVPQTVIPPKPITPPQEMTYKPVMATVYNPLKQRATLDAMTQNTGRGHPKHSWYNRILVNGGMNVDAAWGNRLLNYMGKNPSRLSVNDIYLNTTALVNDWTKVFSSISFNNAYPDSLSTAALDGIKKVGRYSYVYPADSITFEQAYITFGNFDCSPLFAQIGKQYQPFGKYQIHPIERTMSQVLTESLQTSAEVGFISKGGVSGAIYTFDNKLIRSNVGHTLPVYGAMLAIDQPSSDIGYDMGIGYMSNMAGVNDVASAITNYQAATVLNGTNTATIGSYQASVGAVSFYVDLNSGPITVGARYAQSTSPFGTQTLSNNFINADGSTSRPRALDLSTAYSFNAWTKPQSVYVGFQASSNAVNLSLPKNRYLIGYSVDVLASTSLGIQWDHDLDYSSGNGGTGFASNTVNVRAAIKFG